MGSGGWERTWPRGPRLDRDGKAAVSACALMDAARCAEVAALVKSGTRRGGWSAGPEY